MTLSNWLYLGVGITLGVSFRWLFVQFANITSSTSPVVAEQQNDSSQLLQQLQQTKLAYQMAREMSQFKAGFLARTTHELRSPLNGLIGLHQLILSDLCENPAEEREFITQAYERALKLVKLIDEILKVARMEHGTNKLDIQPRQLNRILQDTYDVTYMLAANRNYPFNLILPEPEIYVLTDIFWLRQILVNLLDMTLTKMEEGSIYLSSQVISTEKIVYIWLDVPKNAIISCESVDLMTSELPASEHIKLTDGMKFLLNQTLLEVMQGKLEIIDFPEEREESQKLTRLQISVPLADG
ncbi:MAG TPA: HAMP domain-containing sensor histidine kinase [Nostocaceae cyanobacterium]|nr:HAMP domain-containing sensor histidine kinase [Nostocaceae cyanobacterium]